MMPSSPPPSASALLLLDIPAGILCGIDLLSFTTSNSFRGIKQIPSGWHFVFTSETLSQSIRDGFWFHIPDTSTTLSTLVVRKWEPRLGCLQHCDDDENYRAKVQEWWEKHLSPYRQSAAHEELSESGAWAGLTQHITPRLLSHLTQTEEWRITSASSAKQDRDDIPGLSNEEVGEEKELGVLGIDLKRTWRKGATGRERTEGALDSSWALDDVIDRWNEDNSHDGDQILGQMEACFLMVLTVANYSCLEEWKRCVGLALTCKRAVRQRSEWFARFLVLSRKQMERCEDVEGGSFDMSDEGGGQLKKWLKGFKMTIRQVLNEGEGEDIKEEMEALEAFLKSQYEWNLGDEFVRKGMLDLEDGEQVYLETNEMEGEDERGEYAPVVVELDDP